MALRSFLDGEFEGEKLFVYDEQPLGTAFGGVDRWVVGLKVRGWLVGWLVCSSMERTQMLFYWQLQEVRVLCVVCKSFMCCSGIWGLSTSLRGLKSMFSAVCLSQVRSHCGNLVASIICIAQTLQCVYIQQNPSVFRAQSLTEKAPSEVEIVLVQRRSQAVRAMFPLLWDPSGPGWSDLALFVG